jgi:hypothetical protein
VERGKHLGFGAFRLLTVERLEAAFAFANQVGDGLNEVVLCSGELRLRNWLVVACHTVALPSGRRPHGMSFPSILSNAQLKH